MIQFAAARAAMGALPWKLIGFAALGMFVLGLMLALSMERRQNDKLKAQVATQAAELKRISTAKDEQRKTTDKSIAKGRTIIVEAEGRARKVEAAPLPGNCASPNEVLSADL